jgi:hypothetical protein
VANYMTWVRERVAEDLQLAEETETIDFKLGGLGQVERLLMDEQREMEAMLIDEFAVWEERLQGRSERLLNDLCRESGISAGESVGEEAGSGMLGASC